MEKFSDQYMEIWNMPHVIGALDGKHIAMDCSKGSETQGFTALCY